MEQLAAHEAFHRMSQQDKTLVRRIAEQLRSKDKYELDEILTNYLMAYEGCYGLDDAECWDYLDEIFADAYAGMNRGNMGATKYTDAVRKESQGMKDAANPQQKTNVAATSQQRTAPPKYSIAETEDGTPVAVVDNDILSNMDTSNWNREKIKQARAAAKTALLAFRDGIKVGGITYEVNKTTRDEYTKSQYSERLAKRNPKTFLDKMRTANNANDVITATTQWKQDGKLKHARKDDFADFAHGTVLIQAGTRQYEAETVVGITKNGQHVLYDVVGVKPKTFKRKGEPKAAAAEKTASAIMSSPSDRVAEEFKNVKQKFSLSEPVEQTKTLIAVHNSSWSDIYNAAMEWGGIPSPSVAIVKAEDGHTKFGDTSVVYPRSTIDPETDSRNKVYGADAWTPTKQNARVEREVNYDVKRRIDNEIMELSKNVANGIFSRSSLLESMGYDDVTMDTAEQIAGKLAEKEATKAAYLARQGKNIQPGYKTKVYDSYGNEALQSYIGTMDAQELAGLAELLRISC